VRGKPPRTVGLFKAVGQEVAALRLERGARLPSAYVIQRPDGTPWREHDYRNWRRRRWQEAAARVGVGAITIEHFEDEEGRRRTRRSYEGPTPYWLRHAGVSLLLREGQKSLPELAEENGHSVQTLLRDYAHVIAELKGLPNIPVERQIVEARAELAREAA
jgi:integrase